MPKRRRKQNRHQEDHREVRERRERGQRQPDREGCGHRECRPQERRADRRHGARRARRGRCRAPSSAPRHDMNARCPRRDGPVRAAATGATIREEAAAGASDHDLGDVLELGETQKLGRQCRCPRASCSRRRALSASFKASSMPPPRRVARAAARPLDGHRDPRRIHQVGQTLGGAHERGRDRVRPDAGQDAFAGRPWPLDRLRLHAPTSSASMRSAARRSASSRKRGQVLRLEEVLDARARPCPGRRPCPRPGA